VTKLFPQFLCLIRRINRHLISHFYKNVFYLLSCLQYVMQLLSKSKTFEFFFCSSIDNRFLSSLFLLPKHYCKRFCYFELFLTLSCLRAVIYCWSELSTFEVSYVTVSTFHKFVFFFRMYLNDLKECTFSGLL